MLEHKFPYRWYLKDGYPAKGIEKHGLKIFTTFSCGGGSSMGYKLAGYDVVAANDIDPQMARVYKQNHNPKQFFECPIGDLLKMNLSEYVGIDVLDGSPPCSSFSLAGSREKKWKKLKKFREGQSEQVLSDLFFDWIRLVEKLQPKVAIAENVKGMLIGNAKLYTKQIIKELNRIGYSVQLFLLNSASMGVPQKRERVFFICSKEDKKIKMDFNEENILFGEVNTGEGRELPDETQYKKLWLKKKIGDLDYADILERVENRRSNFSIKLTPNNIVHPTIVSSSDFIKFEQCQFVSDEELGLIQTFPVDYDYCKLSVKYITGMSVPPVMMAQVAYQVYLQLLK